MSPYISLYLPLPDLGAHALPISPYISLTPAKARMLSLGLREGALPQLGFNTKDGRQLAFPHTSAPTEAALSRFAAAFLGEKLHRGGASVPARGPMKVRLRVRARVRVRVRVSLRLHGRTLSLSLSLTLTLTRWTVAFAWRWDRAP